MSLRSHFCLSRSCCAADPTRPLLSCYQAVSDTSFSAGQPSSSVLDLSENLRAKVFSVFCKLGNGTAEPSSAVV